MIFLYLNYAHPLTQFAILSHLQYLDYQPIPAYNTFTLIQLNEIINLHNSSTFPTLSLLT